MIECCPREVLLCPTNLGCPDTEGDIGSLQLFRIVVRHFLKPFPHELSGVRVVKKSLHDLFQGHIQLNLRPEWQLLSWPGGGRAPQLASLLVVPHVERRGSPISERLDPSTQDGRAFLKRCDDVTSRQRRRIVNRSRQAPGVLALLRVSGGRVDKQRLVRNLSNPFG